jgi:tRNA (adenine37-N6)-methyltransferase
MNHDQVCSRCGQELKEDEFFRVDERPVCAACLYPGMEPIQFWPMGIVRSTYIRTENGPGPREVTAEIHLLLSMEPFMDRLEDEKILTVVYAFHRIENFTTRCVRRYDGKDVGVLASRSPHRPSRLAVQDVELLRREGTILYVRGLDALDGSPVLDVKMQHPDHHKKD